MHALVDPPQIHINSKPNDVPNNNCIGGITPLLQCAHRCDCIFTWDKTCPPTHPIDRMLENSGVMNEYCKLGCASSVCDTLTTNQNTDVNEGEVNEAVEHCLYACSELCNKGAKTALANA